MDTTNAAAPEPVAGTLKPRVLRIRDVARLVGLAPSTLYQFMREGRFPRADVRYPGSNVALWSTAKVEAWLDKQIEASSNDAA